MKCFVLTKKHIIAAAAAGVIIACGAIMLSQSKPETVAVFRAEDPGSIISDALPDGEEPSLIEKIKNAIIKEKNKTPDEIIGSYGSVFENAEPSPAPATPQPSPQASEETEQSPAPSESVQPIEEKTINEKPAQISNETTYQVTAEDFQGESISFPKDMKVLIVHTHTTESYAPEDSSVAFDNSRSVDEQKNVIAVGEVIKQKLEENGIAVIHDKTVHDYPSYQGAYGRSLTTVKEQIAADPSIAMVLDVHRDAIVKSDGTRIKLTADINGADAAQVMLVCGSDGTGLNHPGWRKNLNFSIKLQQLCDKKFPGLMRPINLREERFNQHLTENSLILEMGTNGNTLSEAKTSAAFIGEALSELICQNQN